MIIVNVFMFFYGFHFFYCSMRAYRTPELLINRKWQVFHSKVQGVFVTLFMSMITMGVSKLYLKVDQHPSKDHTPFVPSKIEM